MNIAEITVEKSEIEIVQNYPVTVGMVGVTVLFRAFSPEWNGLSKTAVFRSQSETRDVVNIQEGEPVMIPWEVLQLPQGDLTVSVSGKNADGTVVASTVRGPLGAIKPGASPVGKPTQPPTPDWTAQIEHQVNHTLEEVLAIRPMMEKAEAASAAVEDNVRTTGESAARAETAAQKAEEDAKVVSRGVEYTGNYVREVRYIAAEARKEADRAKAEADRAAETGGGVQNETDPTVPDWAKQPQKPLYTAEEVHAIPVPEIQGTAGQFAVSNGTGGINWKTVETWKGGAF